ncbi:MAG: hypothetical protein A2W25_04230 [candidate division Zixibacteria bacterium RBG_16_53_22]|nr:MAG: hypothetical protein A2W25_04230 [candidate division Zixibacteria bacterium RBG_16_53_22]
MKSKKPKKIMTDVCRARSNGPTSLVITIKKSIVNEMNIEPDDHLIITFKKISMDKILAKALKSR